LSARPVTAEAAATRPARRSGPWRRLRRNPWAVAGMVFLAVVVLAALLAPVISPYAPDAQDLFNRLSGPSAQHVLGTDELGRDMLTRLIYGARITLVLGLGSTLLGAAVGVAMGVIGGFYGGLADQVVTFVIDTLMCFPGLLLALLIIGVLGAGTANVLIAIALYQVPTFGRLVRGNVLSLREREYVEAARAAGAGSLRQMLVHVLANTWSTIIVVGTLALPGAILTEAALSFLGLGVKPPTPEWGSMVSTGEVYMGQSPGEVLFPGLAIFFTALAFNFLGDALSDALDPKRTD
jgi:peptide/nickel transport system permease protein